jgi:hypothetical protein
MSEGIRVGLQEEVLMRPGRLGTLAVFQSRVSQSRFRNRFHLLHQVGLVLAGLAFSAQAHSVPTNVDAAHSDAASGRGTLFVVATEAPGNDQLPLGTKTLTNESNAKASEQTAAFPSIGVALICGLALFVWVQRFRNSLV